MSAKTWWEVQASLVSGDWSATGAYPSKQTAAEALEARARVFPDIDYRLVRVVETREVVSKKRRGKR